MGSKKRERLSTGEEPPGGGFDPQWASPPGDTIADLLEERGGSRTELARRCGLDEAQLEALLAGRAPLTEAVAEGLAAALGSTREFWLQREVRFREACARRAKRGAAMGDGALKPGWRRWRFDQIAVNVNDRVDDPKRAGVDRYVGLEHLDPESLRIRRWGTPDDVEATKLRFRAGDIVFGRRRAYQRKLAVADFDGICSAHAMVLRARPEVVLPEFLPFFLQSDVFMERAQAISVGSLSPTINWKTLAGEEFALPPLQDQGSILRLLTAALHTWHTLADCHVSGLRVLESALCDEFDSIQTRAPLQSFSAPIVRGIDSPGPNQPDGVPYVRIAEMTGPAGIVVERLLRTTKEKADDHPASRLLEGDIVVALRGVVGLPVWVPKSAEGANLSRGTARVSVTSHQNREFVYWALRSPRVRQEVLRVCTGWKGEDLREITLEALRNLLVPAPVRTTQDEIARRISAVAAAIDSIADRESEARKMLREIVHSSLSGESNVH